MTTDRARARSGRPGAEPASRRAFLASVGATATAVGLSGCLAGGGLPFAGGDARSVYAGAYHWGFLLLDDGGEERGQVVLDRGDRFRLVAFNTEAERAVASLPDEIRAAVPEHHDLEERNEGRLPPPSSGDLHALLEAANTRYPDHSVAVLPTGTGGHMGGGMMDGMTMDGLALPADATAPTVERFTATRRGAFDLVCLVYCGYGHPYMRLEGAFVVR